jgi:predicted dehydrogenase
MAYCFRYHPLYQALRKAVHAGEIGRVFHAHTWQASYLPGWHPWEDYRTGYAARADLGGGVLRTLDHDLDLLRWVLGQPRAVLASAGTLSGIGVEVEDTADMIFRFSGPLQANSHVCFGRQDLCRGFWAIGEEGSATVDWGRGTLTINRGKDIARVVSLPPGYDLNQAYLEMLRDAVGGFAEDPPRAAVPLADGVAALEMALGALESSSSGRLIPLKGA